MKGVRFELLPTYFPPEGTSAVITRGVVRPFPTTYPYSLKPEGRGNRLFLYSDGTSELKEIPEEEREQEDFPLEGYPYVFRLKVTVELGSRLGLSQEYDMYSSSSPLGKKEGEEEPDNKATNNYLRGRVVLVEKIKHHPWFSEQDVKMLEKFFEGYQRVHVANTLPMIPY